MRDVRILILILTTYASFLHSYDLPVSHMNKIKSSPNNYILDQELRSLEQQQLKTLKSLITNKAQELGFEFFTHFSINTISSEEQAWEYRSLYVPILYKLGLTKEASDLSQATFEYLFPQLHAAVEAHIVRLFGEDYIKKCHALTQPYLSACDHIIHKSYRIKSTHSIWKKMKSLEALEHCSREDFASYFNDFIGIRWEMHVPIDGNRYDALINGVRLAPLNNIITFRNQYLPQEHGFGEEPVIKLCYIIDGFPIELQLLGGALTAYMCAKGYSDYKTKLSLIPEQNELYYCHRLGMAAELGDTATFQKYMFDELQGVIPDYSHFIPFVLAPLPLTKQNRTPEIFYVCTAHLQRIQHCISTRHSLFFNGCTR